MVFGVYSVCVCVFGTLKEIKRWVSVCRHWVVAVGSGVCVCVCELLCKYKLFALKNDFAASTASSVALLFFSFQFKFLVG